MDENITPTENTNEQNLVEPNYDRSMVAIELGKRNFKLRQVEYNLSESQKAKKTAGILAGIFAAGAVAAGLYSGMDTQQAIETEISAINSWESLKEYMSLMTPGIIATVSGFVLSMTKFIKNNKKSRDLMVERENLIASDPVNFLEAADNLERSR